MLRVGHVQQGNLAKAKTALRGRHQAFAPPRAFNNSHLENVSTPVLTFLRSAPRVLRGQHSGMTSAAAAAQPASVAKANPPRLTWLHATPVPAFVRDYVSAANHRKLRAGSARVVRRRR